MQGLDGVTYETGYVNPGAVLGSCHPGDWIRDPGYSVWEGCHPGDYSRVTPDAGCVRGVTLETGRVTPSTWSGREITLESVDM